ncbi:uncharacterized protein [Magallana gigas]
MHAQKQLCEQPQQEYEQRLQPIQGPLPLLILQKSLPPWIPRTLRKLRLAPVKKLPDHYEYSVIEESRITETVDDSISPTTTNYFVLEVTEGPCPPPTNLSSNTAPTPCSSSEYETVQLNNEPEKPSEGVYNTLRENSTQPDDVTDNYSRFADFNQEYCHLQR